jgi:magnesium transporter
MEKLLIPAVRELIAARQWPRLREMLFDQPVAELADLLLELEEQDRVLFFHALPRPLAAQVFAELEAPRQNDLLQDLTSEATRQLLADLSPDDRTQLLEELPGQVTQRLLNLLSPEDLRETRQLLGYPRESVGRLMTPDYVAVRPSWTIAQALDHIRRKGRDSETVSHIYITDSSWKLLDELSLRRFILADPATTVAEIMDYSFVSLSAFEDREAAVQMMQRYDLSVLPVVDSDGILVGIVTFDDVLDVAAEETTEDFYKSAAIAPVQGRYLDMPYLSLYRKRIGWLIILVFINMISVQILASHEAMLDAFVVLLFFTPLLIDSGGNAGSQASTLMVRALALGDVELRDWFWLLVKEISVSLGLGLTMAAAVFGLGWLRGGTTIGLIVALTMVSIVVVGGLIGTVLPFLLSRFKFDPATASGPLITSLADISAILIYTAIAAYILGM